jgi:multiple sugar transport system permease protein
VTALKATRSPSRVTLFKRSARPYRRGRRRGGIGSTIVAIVILGVMLFPVYWMVNVALQPAKDLLNIPPELFPTDATLSAFSSAISNEAHPLLISLIVASGTAVLSLIIAAPAAYGMAQLKLRMSGMVLFALLIAQMVPGIVMANALFKIMSKLDLVNKVPALILADSTLAVPFAVLILRAFMVSLPRELIESAYVDGASRLRTLVSIVLPISRNALITAGLFSFLFAWSDFLFGLTLTTTNSIIPITVGLYRFIGTYSTYWNRVMATGVLASIPAAVLLVLAQRYVSAGITGGAVKE